MKRLARSILLTFLALFIFAAAANAAPPSVIVLYENNAQTTYDKRIDKLMLGNLKETIAAYNAIYIDGEQYKSEMKAQGMNDLAMVERAEIAEFFKNSSADYAILLKIEPFIAKETVTTFTKGKRTTAAVPFKFIDLKNNRYIYNGKVTMTYKAHKLIGKPGNKSVALKALKEANKEINEVIRKTL